jgi:hypothetical protein
MEWETMERRTMRYDALRHLGDDAVAEISLSLSLLRSRRFEDGGEEIHCKV